MGGFTAVPGALGSDVSYYDPSLALAIPDPATVGSTFNLSDIPDFFGTAGMSSDPSGSTAIGTGASSGSGAPNNPNATGGFMSVLNSILAAGNKAMSTYVQGSPSVAIPPVRRPTATASGTPAITGLPTGVNWKVVGISLGVGVAALIALGYFA